MGKMSDPLPALSEAQLEIMNLIWENAGSSVTDVWKTLQQRRGVARNTVHTLMSRLAEKGWLLHHESANGTFLYRAAVTQDAVQQRCVEDLVQNVFGGSAEKTVLALLSSQGVSAQEAKRIEAMIKKARRKNR